MKKHLLKVISLFLIVCVVFGSIPMYASAAYDDGIQMKINEIVKKWGTGSYFTTDGKPGTHNNDARTYYPSVAKANGFNWKNMRSSYTCCGFSHFVFRYIFGYEYTEQSSNYSTTDLSYSGLNSYFSKLQKGDVIYFHYNQNRNCGSHFVVFLSFTPNNGISVYDSNIHGGDNKVTYGHTFSYSFLIKYVYQLESWHARNWDAVNETRVDYNTESPCDIDLETTVADAIHRNGPAKTFSEVGRFPKGQILHAKAYNINSYGNKWYKLDDDSWIYEGRVKKLSNYVIKYDANGGSGAPASQTKKKNQNVALSKSTPTKKWNRFVQWDDTVNKICVNPGATYTANRSTTLKAVWEPTITNVSLSKYISSICINENDKDTVTLSISGYLPKGSKIVTRSNREKTYCTLTDISNFELHNAGFLKATVTIKALQDGDDILYIYIRDSKGNTLNTTCVNITAFKKYTVKYNANGGSGAPASQAKQSNKNLTLSDVIPKREHYTFMGWTNIQNGSTPIFGPGDLVTNEINSNTTLYAIWKKDYYIKSELLDNGKTLKISGNGDMAFFSQSSLPDWSKYRGTVETIEIESGVTSIGSYAFYGFSKVKNVNIPMTMNVIYNHAFSNCTNLSYISLPYYTNIKPYAFSNCKNLKNVRKSSSTRAAMTEESAEIGAFAFSGCENLESFDLKNVGMIGEGAFSNCSSLDNISIPEGISIIEDTAFFDCSNLKSIDIPKSVTEISDGAFSGCTSIQNIDIPDNISRIGSQSFSGCSSISNLTIPEDIKMIGESAFSNCTSLESVSLPQGIDFLADGMFSGCSKLDSVSIPDSVVVLGNGTFLGCKNLSEIVIPEQVINIGSSTFSGCTSLSSVTMSDAIYSIGNFAFYGCTNLRDFYMPTNTREIGSCTFAHCTSLESVNIPESVEVIGNSAFMGCIELKTVNIDNNAPLTIKDEAFASCTSLKEIMIPESAISVSSSAFSNCSSSLNVACYSTSSALNGVQANDVNCNVLHRVQGIDISKKIADLKYGEKLQLSAIFAPSDVTNKKVIWSSDCQEIATVSDSGLVTAVGSGPAMITVRTEDGGFESSCIVNCTVPVKSIDIGMNIVDPYVGTEILLNYEFNPISPTNINATWSSSDNNVATVDDKGLLKVVGEGNVTITITAEDGNKSDSISFTAKKFIPVEEITFSDKNISVNIGETTNANYGILPLNASDNSVFVYSDDDSIATVDEFGRILGVSEGNVKIYVVTTDGEISNYVNLTVNKKTTTSSVVKNVSINDIIINYKASAKINPTITADEGAEYTVKYESSNPKVATVDENGKVYAAKRGDATITCTVTDSYGNTVSDTCKVTVNYTFWQWLIKIILFGWIWY